MILHILIAQPMKPEEDTRRPRVNSHQIRQSMLMARIQAFDALLRDLTELNSKNKAQNANDENTP